jgi:23S rRNA (uracil1939-C5)-methyltransferase
MPRRPYPLLEKITILDAGSEGKAIARVNDMVVFVPFAVPGDIVDVQVVAKKKKFFEGRIMAMHQPSERRIEAFCSHFGTCGGCKWQIMPYEDQLMYKQKQVEDAFTRIGKFEYPAVRPILASPNTTYYRNKLEYAFSNRRWLSKEDMQLPAEERQMNALGFHIPQLFDRILDIDHCYLQPEPSNEIRLEARDFALKNGYSFFDARTHEGLLRNLVIRNTTTGHLMLIVVFSQPDMDLIHPMMDHLADHFPQITSLMYIINEKKNDVITDQEVLLWKGEPYMIEEMAAAVKSGKKLKFKIGPVSFYQTNPVQAFHLYSTAFEFAGFKGEETVYDLYCGTGTITNFVAPHVKKVVGIEYVESAILDARENSELNGIHNTVFHAGDLAKILDHDFVRDNGQPDIVITDPPRSGMHEKVIKQLLDMAPEKIVYVSCNPATQARDIALLNCDYEVTAVQPVDMFPHTHHVENVALLIHRRRTGSNGV